MSHACYGSIEIIGAMRNFSSALYGRSKSQRPFAMQFELRRELLKQRPPDKIRSESVQSYAMMLTEQQKSAQKQNHCTDQIKQHSD